MREENRNKEQRMRDKNGGYTQSIMRWQGRMWLYQLSSLIILCFGFDTYFKT